MRTLLHILSIKMTRCWLLFVSLLLVFLLNALHEVNGLGRVMKKEDWRQIVSTDCGEISAVDINFEDEDEPRNHLQFISLEPNSLFLPALLHADMILYVHTGSGTLSYTDGKELKKTGVRKGDVYRLKSDSVFYIQSSAETQQGKLRLFALFSDAVKETSRVGPYSGIRDLFQGFDTKLLQAAFQAPEEVMEEIMKAAKMAPIVQADADSTQKKKGLWDKETVFLKAFLEINGFDKDFLERNKKKKHKKDEEKEKEEEETSFNLFKAKRYVDNCAGWTSMVTPKDLHAMEGSSIGAFIVNLSTGAMAGPHWNPSGTEIAVVVEGRGMVHAVCSSNSARRECNNTRFLVTKGDIFAIPRSQPVAHMSFNNETLVFMGFSVPAAVAGSSSSSCPQFLAGKDSFLHVLDKQILELVFGVNSTTVSKLLGSRTESIHDCVSCAEEEEERMVEAERKPRPEEEEEEEEEEEGEEEEEEEGEWDREGMKRGWKMQGRRGRNVKVSV